MGDYTLCPRMLLRTSHALIMCPDDGQTVGFNFLKQSSFVCNEHLLTLLHFLNEWRPVDQLGEIFPDFSTKDIEDCIHDLIEVGAVIEKGSAQEQEEIRKIESWEWGVPSAMLHYCEQNRRFLSRERAEDMQRERAKYKPLPDAYKLNCKYDTVRSLPQALGKGNVLDLMSMRRTEREIPLAPIELETLSDCLFAGMGITAETENCVSSLPLSMTPSGGARNPYEAYVYARQVDGLASGFYHYSAVEHSLGLIKCENLENPASLVGDQPWVNNMAAIVFLCADFTRTMWKYQDNNAYRVILIEAGHIGQNIMLSATEHGCTACPSAALAHGEIAEHLDLDHDLQSPIYALMIGKKQIQSH